MEPTIIKREETILVGLASADVNMYALWQAFDAFDKQIKHKAAPAIYYEVHTFPDDPHSGQAPEYLVGVVVTQAEDIPAGALVRRLPAGAYAVFTHHLANGGFTGCNEAMDAWLKNRPYQLSPNMSIQVFDDRFKGPNNPESIIDFLLPIREKKE